MRAPLVVAARSVSRGRAGGVLDALLHGRGWIALVGVLLVGIVFFNVDLLKLNRQIARTADRASALKRENARLRLEVARLGSSERIQRAAARRGLVLPAPGDVRYLRAVPSLDARRAARRITEPAPKQPSPSPAPVQPQAPVQQQAPVQPQAVTPTPTG